MKDVLVSFIFMWILWKIFGGRTVVHRYTVNQNHTHTYNAPKAGEVKVEKEAPKKPSKLSSDEGEYIDYEEIK
jgi:hypothetical protein